MLTYLKSFTLPTLSPIPSNLTISHPVIPYVTIVDRYNKDIVEIALSLEDEDTVELHRVMTDRFPVRVVSERYKHGNYHTNAEAIVLSNWSYRKPYIMCGLPGFGGAPSSCHQTLVCECCCKKAAARMYVRYKDSFHKALHWYALTYSFTSNVFLDTATQAEYLERFALADRFIKSLRVSGLIQGAVAVKEVFVNSFHAKAVFPHTHVVANSDRSDLVDDNGNMHEDIAEEAARVGVSLRIVKITDPEVFLYELKYPLKPINIKQLYQEEAINHNTNDINLGVDMVLGRLTQYTKGKPRIVYYGNMDARCKDYMGTEMNKERKAKRKRIQLETKELNSPAASPTMVNEHVSTKDAAVMPLPQPVLPPQAPQKKRNLWGTMALGLGAGVAGLGAADFLWNKGRATNSIVDAIKSRFGGQSAPVTPPATSGASMPLLSAQAPLPRVRKPVTLGLPKTQADVMADAAAGTIGNNANSGARDAWIKWMHNERGLGAENAFRGAVTKDPNTITHPLAFNTEDGELGHIARGLGAEQSPNKILSTLVDGANGVTDKVNDMSFKGMLAIPAASGALNLASKIPGVGGSGALAKATTGVSNLGKLNDGLWMSKDVPGWARTAGRGVGAFGGAAQAARLGINPLTVEAVMDKFPNMSYEQASALAATTYAGVGGAAAARIPVLGNLVLTVDNALADNAVRHIREMSGSVAERGALADLMSRWYRGAQSGSSLHRNALERALQYIDQNKDLQSSIADGRHSFWDHFTPGPDDSGSPALQSLINKSRQAIMH